MNPDDAKIKYGQRIQRCSGCYGAFYLRDMWLGPEAAFFCGDCRDDSMFHFDEFTRRMDISMLPCMNSEDEESSQCQNPFTRQV
jgi:hypothetical protein